MKAAICTAYGGPEVLVIQEVDRPKPKSNELLIQVYASAVHSGDRRLRALDVPTFGKLPMRMVVGFKAPRQPILGVVLAGIVVETGKSVKNFQVGDNVYSLTGMRFGGYAEFACVNESKCVVKMPEHASFIEAAALPFGGTTSLHFLRKAHIERAKNVLIYGGAGAVGSTAVQIAKHFGVHVTAVCHERNVELVKRLGADVVIDYSKEGYDRELGTYDVVFDASGKIEKRLARKQVAENGSFRSVAGQGPASERKEDLMFLNELFESGALQPVIDSVYPLDEIVEAHRYVDRGKKVGNVIVTVK
ncbi:MULTISPECIES: NAD(P)-dependent alcohol dehydrogenase [unclassified Exiguobacterium]|uniref:NAD(P)-dependent alcohol dehydrogenase n=1 Tax=unclassified Exiguobacterium TaxID=2644629 RepID=UPI001BED26AB